MMLVLKILLLLLVFFMLSCTVGYLIIHLLKLEDKSICLLFVSGAIGMLLLFMILNLICALFHLKLAVLGLIWLVTMLLALCFVLVKAKDFLSYIKEAAGKGMQLIKQEMNWFSWVLFGLILILICLQLFGTSCFAYHQPNATRQVRFATLAYDTGSLSWTSPFMMLWALLAGVLKEHPLTIVFSVSQFVLLPLYYAGYFLLADRLDGQDRDRSLLIVLFLCILHIFGYQSGYALNMTLLFGYFSGEVFFLQGFLPFLLWLFLTIRKKLSPKNTEECEHTEEYEHTEAGEWDEEDWEDMDMKKHKIMNARNVGIALLVFAALAMLAIYILNNKINSLHAATQNLQTAMNEKCSIYEFKPAESEMVQGYLLKQSDGSLVMIGGGSTENGEALYEFISKYGSKLDQWYLYGETDKATAYEYCTGNKDLEVGSVYYLSGMEEVK